MESQSSPEREEHCQEEHPGPVPPDEVPEGMPEETGEASCLIHREGPWDRLGGVSGKRPPRGRPGGFWAL